MSTRSILLSLKDVNLITLIMAKLFKVFAFSTVALSFQALSLQATQAEDTIYTWTDEQESLTNYGGIPPDEELGSDAVKVIDLQKGVTTRLDFPPRAADALLEKNQQLKPPAAYGAASNQAAAAGTPATSAPKMLGSSTPLPSASATAPKPAVPKPTVPLLASGKSDSFINEEEARKLSEQENKLEAQAKSARRIALEKRRDEMKTLAERVRNGAASRQEIAALMTYRQTASFGEARSALARPKSAKKVELRD